MTFSNWVEAGEVERGHLRHKVWLRLRGWPILCWNREDVKATVSGFGELWEVDDDTTDLADVSCYRVLVRCGDVSAVPATLSLMVEDRCFRVDVEVDSWEAAAPILLGEDRRLGLTTREDQDRFQANSAFSAPLPALSAAGGPAAPHPPLGRFRESSTASASSIGPPRRSCGDRRGRASRLVPSPPP